MKKAAAISYERSNRRMRGAATAVLVALGALTAACDGNASEEATCVSPPRAVSDVYSGDPNANPDDQSTWTTGIQVETEPLPEDAIGVRAGFKGPDQPNSGWRDSETVDADSAKRIKLRIGPGDVVFSTQIVAPEGSPACEEPPSSSFSEPLPVEELEGVAPEWSRTSEASTFDERGLDRRVTSTSNRFDLFGQQRLGAAVLAYAA